MQYLFEKRKPAIGKEKTILLVRIIYLEKHLGREIYKTTCIQSTTKAWYTEQTDPIQMSEEWAWTGPNIQMQAIVK